MHTFAIPIVDSSGVWAYWYACPVTGDPVLVNREGGITMEEWKATASFSQRLAGIFSKPEGIVQGPQDPKTNG
jgi:hypothetical protein